MPAAPVGLAGDLLDLVPPGTVELVVVVVVVVGSDEVVVVVGGAVVVVVDGAVVEVVVEEVVEDVDVEVVVEDVVEDVVEVVFGAVGAVVLATLVVVGLVVVLPPGVGGEWRSPVRMIAPMPARSATMPAATRTAMPRRCGLSVGGR